MGRPKTSKLCRRLTTGSVAVVAVAMLPLGSAHAAIEERPGVERARDVLIAAGQQQPSQDRPDKSRGGSRWERSSAAPGRGCSPSRRAAGSPPGAPAVHRRVPPVAGR